MQGIRLDQHALKIQLAKQLFEYGPLVVLASGVAGVSGERIRAAAFMARGSNGSGDLGFQQILEVPAHDFQGSGRQRWYPA